MEEQDMGFGRPRDELSLTQNIKRFLQGNPMEDELEKRSSIMINSVYESVYELARQRGLTLREWVMEDPRSAVRTAENNVAEWHNLMTMAAIRGAIVMRGPDGDAEYAVSTAQAKLIQRKAEAAERELDEVNEIAMSLAKSGEDRKDLLERVMYRRALKGDNRLAIYLHDRVEGRPMETKVDEQKIDNTYNVYAIIKTLFDKQLEVLNSGNGTRLICCSRRAGKTHLLVAVMLIECLRKPRTRCMYIGETMELSEGLINKAANDIVDQCNLRDKKGRRLDWRHLDNGSEIMVRGLSNTKDPDQIRGAAAKVIVIDEFFHLKSELLEYMQREVLEPMQMDYADDYLFLCAGTPPRVKGTYGEHVWRTWEVPHFTWTWRDNPHPVSLEERKAFVERTLHDKGLDWSSSFARREYNGEWAYDEDLLLYPEYCTYDKSEAMPSIRPTRILFGIDYGVGDNDTIWGCVWNDDEQRGYQFWEDKFNRLDILDRSMSQLEYLAQQVKQAWRVALGYFPDLSPKEANKRILWDADDTDQHLTDYFNMTIRFKEDEEYAGLRLNIDNAHKTDKVIMFDRIRDLLRRGDMLIMAESKCERELQSTILKRGPNGEVYSEVDDKAFHPDLLPAMRYALWNAIGIR